MSDQFIRTVIRACASLKPRQGYARDVIRGRQIWSGADLQGKARLYGTGYARQRMHASSAWYDAGGCIVALRRTGQLVSAIYIGMDDYGTALYETRGGVIPAGGLRD